MTKHIDQSLIDQILNSPQAPVYIEALKAILEKEQKLRKDFYNDITEQVKAEFINGQVIIHSPVVKKHNEVNSNLFKLMDTFVYQHQLGFVGIEKILIQLTRNDYEPDICFFQIEKAQYFKGDQSIFPAPDLVVEVLSKGTEKRDRGIKFEDYEAHRIQEYWIIDPRENTIEQYLLKKDRYDLQLKAKTGEIESQAIAQFKISIQAIFDKAHNFEVLKSMLSS